MPAFKVKLGVIPDYMFEGNGLRIDGVNSGQPASNAGMKKGDVIIQIGDYPVTDIMSYMKTLSMFSKGSKTTIRFIRNNQETIADLQF
jgi:S1-C subfamily serine protease